MEDRAVAEISELIGSMITTYLSHQSRGSWLTVDGGGRQRRKPLPVGVQERTPDGPALRVIRTSVGSERSTINNGWIFTSDGPGPKSDINDSINNKGDRVSLNEIGRREEVEKLN